MGPEAQGRSPFHTPAWRPIAVREVELSRGMSGLADLEGYRTTWVLMRYRGRPLAFSPVPVVDNSVAAAVIWNTAGARAPDALREAVLTDLLHTTAVQPQRPPSATIVVCTRNRPDDLRRCLES